MFNDLKASRASEHIEDLIEQQREQGVSDTAEPLASLLAAGRELSKARIKAFRMGGTSRNEGFGGL